MNKNIIIAGAIAAGLYLFSQTKKIRYTTTAQKIAQRIQPTATPTIRERTAQKIAQKIAQKVAQKVVKEKDEYVRERTPPTLATVIQKRTGVPVSEARSIAEKIAYERARKQREKIAYERARKQRERIAAAHRAVLEKAKRTRIQIAEANRKAAARKNLIHRAVEVLPGVSLHNLFGIIKPPVIKKTTPKVASATPHTTTHSSWTPTAWPVHIVRKKSTLFNYSKPQKKKDLSVLHTAVRWRRPIARPNLKHRLSRPVELPFKWRAERPFSEWRKSRHWPLTIMRRR